MSSFLCSKLTSEHPITIEVLFGMNAFSFFFFLLSMHHGTYSRLKGPARSVELALRILDLIQWNSVFYSVYPAMYLYLYTLLCTVLFVTGCPSDPHPPPKRKKEKNKKHCSGPALSRSCSILPAASDREEVTQGRSTVARDRVCPANIRKVFQKGTKPKVEM